LITRKQDWDVRLFAYIEANSARPFVWGEFDCALFACDCVREMTGVDMASEFRGKYKSVRGALRLIKPFESLMGLANAIALRHGLEKVPWAFAQRGDIVIVPAPWLECPAVAGPYGALGIMCDRMALAPGLEGLIPVPPSTILGAWRV
jgi:hypothetical protein